MTDWSERARELPDGVWCSGCAQLIDPDCCGCGGARRSHSNPMEDGHPYVPMGCNCARTYATSAEALRAIHNSVRHLADDANASRTLLTEALAERDQLRERVAQLESSLREYGEHGDDGRDDHAGEPCPARVSQYPNEGFGVCTCGLDAALRGTP